MQVYLLTSGTYDDYQVFASMEDAERAKVLWGNDKSAQIEELEVLTIPESKHNETPYTVKIPKEEYPVYVSKGWIGIINSVEEGYSFLGDVYRFYVYAVYEEDAKKKAISYFRTLSKLLRKEQQEEQWYPLK
jgi:hypothetical protein